MDVFSTLVGGFFSLVAVCLIVTGGHALRRSVRLLTRGVRVQGRVVGWVKVRSGGTEHGPSDHPRIRFRHPAGREAEFMSELSGSPRRWPVGHVLEVAVIGDAPRGAEVVRPALLLAAPAVMFVLGAAAMVVAAHALFG